MVIAIDFDGTIVQEEFPAVGPEIPGAIRALKNLQRKGHYIILWTCREGVYLQDALKFLELRGFIPDGVNEHHPELERKFLEKFPEYKACSRKVWAHIYIDDKHLGGIPGWDDMERMINKIDQKEKRCKNRKKK